TSLAQLLMFSKQLGSTEWLTILGSFLDSVFQASAPIESVKTPCEGSAFALSDFLFYKSRFNKIEIIVYNVKGLYRPTNLQQTKQERPPLT
uniref:Uncharacterized protein n=1 Tax=Myripristis murdjan TaxID=586833 RepID=A0A667XQA8_9TELE